MLRHLLTKTISILPTFGVALTVAYAGPTNYAQTTVSIRAGVVVTEANRVGVTALNDAPFVWYNLDSNRLVKPAGWNFYNPHGKTQMDQPTQTRWNALATIYGSNGPSALGSQLTKQNAPYWEVFLDVASDSAITDYDVLYLPASNGLLSLTPSEREKLLKFMDKGGVLWVDASGANVDAANGAPISFTTINGVPGSTSIDPNSRLASYPYPLDQQLNDVYYKNPPTDLAAVDLAGNGFAALQPYMASVGPDFQRFDIVGSSNGNPTIVTAHVGNGAMVVTSRGAGLSLNHSLVGGAYDRNQGFTADTPIFDNVATSAGKFAINLVYLGGEFAQGGQGSRKSSGLTVDITAPLLTSWKDETTDVGVPGASPVAFKGIVFTVGQNRLYAYSAKPGSDLDANGNPDDGKPDYGLGKTYDLIWQSVPLNGPISTPVALTVAGGIGDVVMVIDGQGNLQEFAAFPLSGGVFNLADQAPTHSQAPPNGPANAVGAGDVPFPPTAHEGLVYITDNVDNGLGSPIGRVWVYDPISQNATINWAVGGPGVQVFNAVSGGATVGYIPIFDNSGGVDEVVYIPTAPSGGFGVGQAAGIASVWAGTKGEKHPVDATTVIGGNLAFPTRADASGAAIYLGANPLYGVRLVLQTSNGDPLTVAQMATLFSGTPTDSGGVLSFPLKPGVSLANFTALGVMSCAVDYTLDWTPGSPSARSALRGSVQLPDDDQKGKWILGDLALSSAGTLYAVQVENSPGTVSNGSFFAIREQGRGHFKVVTRFDMYPAFTSALQSGQTLTEPITFNDDVDGVTQIPSAKPFISGSFTKLQLMSGPAVKGDFVYVKARGLKPPFGVPCTVLLCFAAEPTTSEIPVPKLQAGFTILQPDPSRSTLANKTQPDVFTQANPNEYVYEEGLDGAKLRFDTLSNSDSGSMTQILNQSLPLIIRQPGRPDLVIEPNLVNGNWSPLQWYMIFHGFDDTTGVPPPSSRYLTTGPPVITGNTLFMAGNSVLPGIMAGLNPATLKPTGVLDAITATISSADPYLQTTPTRPWFSQLVNLRFNGGAISGNPDVLWPQNKGITDSRVFAQRLLQSSLGGSDVATPHVAFGIAAGDGGLFAYGARGFYGFERADFTIADEGRLGSFDASGNALWTSDQSVSFNLASTNPSAATAAVSHALVRPTRAYPISATDYVVADPGSNRIARIDKAGHELRSIDGFAIDPNFVPDGYKTGEPLTFNGPQDVLTFSDYQTSSPFGNAQPLEYWRHYVVADTGNHRIVELVDRYRADPTTRNPVNPIALGVLFYHSPSNLSGKNFDYNTLGRIRSTTSGTYVYAASLGTVTPTGAGLGLTPPTQDTPGQTPQTHETQDGNGGVVVFDGPNTQIINEIVIPVLPAGSVFDAAAGTFNAQPIPSQKMKLGNISSVTLANYTDDAAGAVSEMRIMITTSSGVYEVAFQPAAGGQPSAWVVRWMLPNYVYKVLQHDPFNLPVVLSGKNPLDFRPTYAHRTGGGTVIVVNSYVGQTRNGADFTGEVLELEGNSAIAPNRGFDFAKPFFGFDPLSIRFELPAIQGARGLVAPVFADRR